MRLIDQLLDARREYIITHANDPTQCYIAPANYSQLEQEMQGHFLLINSIQGPLTFCGIEIIPAPSLQLDRLELRCQDKDPFVYPITCDYDGYDDWDFDDDDEEWNKESRKLWLDPGLEEDKEESKTEEKQEDNPKEKVETKEEDEQLAALEKEFAKFKESIERAKSVPCECGAELMGFKNHSDFCGKYVKKPYQT